MNRTIEKHFLHLQARTNSLLSAVSSLSSSTYHYEPGDGKWSISQILTHLLTSERLSVAYMKKKAQAPMDSIPDAGLGSRLRFFLLDLSQRLPLKYKAPRVVVENTPRVLSFGDLVRQWEASRVELKSFLNTISDEHINKEIYKHPYAGRLSVIHAIQFMTMHIDHHRPQIERIIAGQRAKRSAQKSAV